MRSRQQYGSNIAAESGKLLSLLLRDERERRSSRFAQTANAKRFRDARSTVHCANCAHTARPPTGQLLSKNGKTCCRLRLREQLAEFLAVPPRETVLTDARTFSQRYSVRSANKKGSDETCKKNDTRSTGGVHKSEQCNEPCTRHRPLTPLAKFVLLRATCYSVRYKTFSTIPMCGVPSIFVLWWSPVY